MLVTTSYKAVPLNKITIWERNNHVKSFAQLNGFVPHKTVYTFQGTIHMKTTKQNLLRSK